MDQINGHIDQPLLCISLCALLLLPLTLSCDKRNSPQNIILDYNQVVQTELFNTRDCIESLQNSSSCSAWNRTLPNCTSNNTDVVKTLLKLACKMEELSLSTEYCLNRLARSVKESIKCPCKKPSKQKRRKRHINKKLCKAKALLSNMVECYELLNSKHGQDT